MIAEAPDDVAAGRLVEPAEVASDVAKPAAGQSVQFIAPVAIGLRLGLPTGAQSLKLISW